MNRYRHGYFLVPLLLCLSFWYLLLNAMLEGVK